MDPGCPGISSDFQSEPWLLGCRSNALLKSWKTVPDGPSGSLSSCHPCGRPIGTSWLLVLTWCRPSCCSLARNWTSRSKTFLFPVCYSIIQNKWTLQIKNKYRKCISKIWIVADNYFKNCCLERMVLIMMQPIYLHFLKKSLLHFLRNHLKFSHILLWVPNTAVIHYLFTFILCSPSTSARCFTEHDSSHPNVVKSIRWKIRQLWIFRKYGVYYQRSFSPHFKGAIF